MAIGLSFSIPSPAVAQNGAEDASDEIVVTANRRAENLQDAALSVSAFSGEALERSGAASSADLQQLTAGLVINVNSNFAQPYIRGVGTDITTPGAESSVATFIDGVYQAQTFMGVQNLVGIERVEVLKGPQGTLYGRNATGGALIIRTFDPSEEFSANIRLIGGNYSRFGSQIYVTGGLADNVSANLAVSANVRQGFGRQLNTRERFNDDDYVLVRPKIRFELGETADLILTANYLRRRDTSAMAYTYLDEFGSIPLPTALGGRVTFKSQDSYTAYPIGNEVDAWGGNARLTLGVDDATLTSTTAYSQLDARVFSDFVSTDIPIFNFEGDKLRSRTFTQDLILQGSTGRLDWILGGLLVDDRAGFQDLFLYSGPSRSTRITAVVSTQAMAGYADMTFPLTDRLSASGGLRYSWERKQQDRLVFASPDGTVLNSFPQAGQSWDNVSFKALLKYDNGPTMIYAKVESGFKSGTFNAIVPGQSVDPETITAYEAGLKATLLDRSVQFDLAAFYYDYSNLQIQFVDSLTGSTLIETAPKAEVYGIEGTIRAKLGQLSFSANAALMESKFKDFTSSGVLVPNNTPSTPGAPGNSSAVVDVSGNSLTRAPEFTASITAEYAAQFDSGTLTPNVTLSYSSRYFFDVANRVSQPGYALLNASLTYEGNDSPWSFGIWGRNLTDERYVVAGSINAFGDAARIGDPLTFGAEARLRF
jgi:iron complex outermembrane receptor protein